MKKFHRIITFITALSVATMNIPLTDLAVVASESFANAATPLNPYDVLEFSEEDVGSTKNIASTPEVQQLASGLGALSYAIIPGSSKNLGGTTVADNAVITVDSSGNVTIVGTGSAQVRITAAETDDYLEATKDITISVGKDKVNISFGTVPTKTYGDAAFTLATTFKSNAAPTKTVSDYGTKTYSSSNTAVATITNAGVVTIKGAGSTTITCSLAANDKYNASSNTCTLTVNKATNTITVTGLKSSSKVGDAAYNISGTASSGGAITFSSTNTNVISVAATGTANTVKLTPLKAGNCYIKASVPTNSNYASGTYTSPEVNVSAMSSNDIVNSGVLTTTNKSTTYSSTNTSISIADAAAKHAINSTVGIPTGAISYSINQNAQPAALKNCGTVSGTTFSFTKAGTYTLTATMAADANYSSASKTFTVAVAKGSQIATANNITATYQDPAINLAGHAVVSEGNGTVTYSIKSQAPNKTGGQVVALSGTTLSIKGAGTAVITATVAATDQYNATSIDFTVTVNKKAPTLAFAAGGTGTITKTYLDPAFGLTGHVTSNSNEGAITYAIISNPSNTVSLSGSTITILKSGTVTIRATQAESPNWASASLDFVISVAKAIPQLSASNATKTYGDADFDLAGYITTNTDGALTFGLASTSATDVISISGSTAHILNQGSATVTVVSAETDKFLAGSQISFVVTVGRKNADIDPNGDKDWSTGISKVYLDPSFSITDYFQTDSDGVLTYSSSNEAVISVNATTGAATVGIVGTATITVNIAETRNYNAKEFQIAAEVIRANPTQSANPLNATYLDAPIDLNNVNGGTYITTNSPGAVTYTLKAGEPTGVISITNNVVSFLGYGTVTVVASQEETANFNSKSIEFTVSVAKATPSIAAADIDKNFKDANFSLLNHAVTNSNGAVTYTVYSETGALNATTGTSIDDVIDISGTTATVKNAGEAIIEVAVAETDQFNSGTITFKIKVAPITPTASADNINKVYLDPPFSLAGHATFESDGTVSYVSNNTEFVTISGDTATIVAAGTARITAHVTATQNYVAHSIDFNIIIDKAQSSITGTTHYDKLTTSPDFNLDATTTSTCLLTYESSDTDVVTVDSTGKVHIVAIGTATITVTANENANYYGSTMDVTVTVIRDTPTLTGDDLSLTYESNAVDMLAHMSYNGDGAFSYSNYDTDIIRIANHMLYVVNAGETDLKITSAETPTWNSVSKTIHVTVARGTVDPGDYDIITDPDDDDQIIKTYEDPDFNIGFTSKSDGAVTYSSSDTTVATIDANGVVHILKAGTITLTVNIAQTRNWNAATIYVTLLINKCSVRFENTDALELTCKQPSFTLPVTWNSDSAYTYASQNSRIVDISQQGIVTVGVKGETKIIVTLAENEKYFSGYCEIPVKVTVADPDIGSDNVLIEDDELIRRYGDPDINLEITSKSDAELTYTSSDETIVTVTNRGKLHVVGVGEADIVITTPETDFYAAGIYTIHVKVLKKLLTASGSHLNGIQKPFESADFRLDVKVNDDTVVPQYSVEPAGIVTISDAGIVSIVAPGSAEIIFTCEETATTEKLVVRIPITVEGRSLTFIGSDLYGITTELGVVDRPIDIQPYLDEINPKPQLTIEYSSSDTNVFTVKPNGTLTAVGAGTAYLTVKAPTQSPFVESKVLVPVTVNYKDLKFSSESTIRTKYGDPDFTVYPILFDRAATPNFTFESSNEKVVKVSNEGMVTIMGVGSAVITAHCDAFGNYGECTINTAVIVSKGDVDIKADNITMSVTSEPVVIACSSKSDGKITYATKDTSIISLADGKVAPVAEGTAVVTVTVAETEFYNQATTTFTVTVNPDNSYNVGLDDFINTTQPKYNSELGLRLTITDIDETKTVPFIIYHEESDSKVILYQGTISSVAGSKVSTDFKIHTGDLAGRITLYAQLSTDYDGFDTFPEDNTKSLDIEIPLPEYTIEMGDINKAYSPGQYITVPYKLTGWNLDSNTRVSVQLCIDNTSFALGYADVGGATPTIFDSLSGYLPATLTTGEHTLAVEIVPDKTLKYSDSSVLTDSKKITVSTADLSLSVNDIVVSQVDSFAYSSTLDECELKLKAVNPDEIITKIELDGRVYSINKNEDTFKVALEKSESVLLSIEVQSACGTKTKIYSLIITRANDNTDITVMAVTADGTQYLAEIIDGLLQVDLPISVSDVNIIVKTLDSKAQILTIDEVSYNKPRVEYSKTLEESYTAEIVVQAEDSDIKVTHRVLFTNKNYTPEIVIENAREVSGTVYGSQGILRDAFIEYGPDITSVEIAHTAGKLHGVILDLKVKDKNYLQYLAGYFVINNVRHQIHWGSFDGPTVMPAIDVDHGYVYVDSTYFKQDISSTAFDIIVEDFENSSAVTPLSSTSASITFSVKVSPGDFQAYYDEATTAIVITTLSDGEFTYRMSVDNGITWTDSQPTGTTIPVTEKGISQYEITLTDSLHNTVTKTVTVNRPSDSSDVEDANVFTTTSRHADYIYINTKKSNASAIGAGITELFTIGSGE